VKRPASDEPGAILELGAISREIAPSSPKAQGVVDTGFMVSILELGAIAVFVQYLAT
jgi:hypothetical protein